MQDRDTPIERYRALWSAVLAQALKDAALERAGPEAQHEARLWLRPGNPDLAFVCDAAGIPRSLVLDEIRGLRARNWRAAP